MMYNRAMRPTQARYRASASWLRPPEDACPTAQDLVAGDVACLSHRPTEASKAGQPVDEGRQKNPTRRPLETLSDDHEELTILMLQSLPDDVLADLPSEQ